MDIRLKEFLHNLKDHDFDVCGQYKVDENEADKVIEALEDDGWILCNKEMPKKNGRYLCVFKHFKHSTTYNIDIDAYINNAWLTYQDTVQVIAWQPLPEWRGDR